MQIYFFVFAQFGESVNNIFQKNSFCNEIRTFEKKCSLFPFPFLFHHVPIPPKIPLFWYMLILFHFPSLPLSLPFPLCFTMYQFHHKPHQFWYMLILFYHVPKRQQNLPKLVHALHISENCCIFAQNF